MRRIEEIRELQRCEINTPLLCFLHEQNNCKECVYWKDTRNMPCSDKFLDDLSHYIDNLQRPCAPQNIHSELRPCAVIFRYQQMQVKGLFHCWCKVFDSAKKVEETRGLIEFENGRLHCISPRAIIFCDDIFQKYPFSTPQGIAERRNNDTKTIHQDADV